MKKNSGSKLCRRPVKGTKPACSQTHRQTSGTGVLYSRTSRQHSKAQVRASVRRQHEGTQRMAQTMKVPVVTKVAEVISGSKPLEQRKILLDLLRGKMPEECSNLKSIKSTNLKIFVESCRAIARDCMVGEQLYQVAKAHGVEIVPSDIPNLFTLHPTPAEAFTRRVFLALQELDRDQIHFRTAKGLEERKLTSKNVTQAGTVKVNGAKTRLECLSPKALRKFILQARLPIRQYKQGKMGLRPLAAKLSQLLRCSPMSHCSAQRLVAEVGAKRW